MAGAACARTMGQMSRRVPSASHSGGDGTSAWAILHELFVETLGDARRVGVLLSSALAASGLESPPTSGDAVVTFAKTHLLPLVRDEVGARTAVAWIAQLESRLAALPPATPQESGRRRRDQRDTVPVPPQKPPIPVTLPPFRKKLPSITGDERRPVALLVGARALERSGLARALVQAGIDVRSVETVQALATMLAGENAVRLAIVDLDGEDAKSIVSTVVASRPDLPVVARTAQGGVSADEASAAGLKVVYAYARRMPPPDVVERIRALALPEEPASAPPPTDLVRTPRLIVAIEDIGWYGLDAGALGLVREMDGVADLATLAHRCGLTPDDALRIARALVTQGVIVLA